MDLQSTDRLCLYKQEMEKYRDELRGILLFRGCVLRSPNSTAKIRLSLRKNATRTATTKHYDWALLNNRDIRDEYVLELRNRFETLQEKTEIGTPYDEY